MPDLKANSVHILSKHLPPPQKGSEKIEMPALYQFIHIHQGAKEQLPIAGPWKSWKAPLSHHL